MIEIKNIHISIKGKEIINEGKLKGERGKITLIKGKSGCGKTSLLYQVCLLGKSNVDYYYDGVCVSDLNENYKSNIREKKISFVMQDVVLVDHLTVYENICEYSKAKGLTISKKEIDEMLNCLNIFSLKNIKVLNLSGGERQRVSIACMIAKRPELLLLDEPTSQLDEKNEKEFMKWLRIIVNKYNICVVMTSHRKLEAYADDVYIIKNKKIYAIKQNQNDIDLENETKKIHEDCKSNFSNYFRFQKIREKYFLFKMFCVVLIIPTITSLIFYVVNDYQKKQLNLIDQNTEKELFYNDSKIEKGYIDEYECSIMFYYPQNKIKKYIKQQYEDDGCLISYTLFQKMKQDLKGKEKQIFYQDKAYELKIAGILYDTKIINKDIGDYVMIPIDVYSKMIDTKSAYFIENMDDLNKQKKDLVFSLDNEMLKKYTKTKLFYKQFIEIMKVVIVVFSSFISYIWLKHQESKLVFDYIEGKSLMKLTRYLTLENIIYYIVIILLGIIFNLFFNFGISTYIENVTIFFFTFEIVTICFIRKLNFLKILRE